MVGEEQNNDQRSTFSGDDNSVQPHPAFGYDVNQFSQMKQSTNKRYQNDDEMSNKSEIETERYTKKAKYVENNSQDKEFKKQTTEFMLDKRLQLVEKQSINPKLLNYVVRLPKLFRILKHILGDIKGLEEDVEDLENDKERLKTLNQTGSGQDKKIKEVNEAVKKLFGDVIKIKEFLKDKSGNIESIEKLLQDTNEIANLFRCGNYNDFIYKIEQLRNAAFAIHRSEGFLEKDLKNKERQLIKELAFASPFEAREILDEYFPILKDIFKSMMSYEDIKNIVENYKVNRLGYIHKLDDKVDLYNESENDESEEHMTEEVENTDEKEADETEDEELNADNESEYEESEEYQPMMEEVENVDVNEKEEAEETADEDWNVDNGSDKSEDYQSIAEG